MSQRKKIARNLSVKMLSYTLGRTIIFTDEPTQYIGKQFTQ